MKKLITKTIFVLLAATSQLALSQGAPAPAVLEPDPLDELENNLHKQNNLIKKFATTMQFMETLSEHPEAAFVLISRSHEEDQSKVIADAIQKMIVSTPAPVVQKKPTSKKPKRAAPPPKMEVVLVQEKTDRRSSKVVISYGKTYIALYEGVPANGFELLSIKKDSKTGKYKVVIKNHTNGRKLVKEYS